MFEVVETDIQLLFRNLFIDTASGDFLDRIGSFFSLNRLSGETDDSYRTRIVAVVNTFLASSSIEGIKQIVALITGLSTDTIELVERESFVPLQLLANMETGETWTGTYVSADTSFTYEGTGSKKIDITSKPTVDPSETIYGSLTRTINLQRTYLSKRSFRVYYYADDFSKVNELALKLTDSSSNEAICESSVTDLTSSDWVYFLEEDFAVDEDFDWSDIATIELGAKFNDKTFINIDYLIYGILNNNMKFDLYVEVTETTTDDKINIIKSTVNAAKATGTKFDNLYLISAGSIFRINISDVDGADRII